MKDNAYFDNAATSWPKPESVYAFMDSFFRSHGVNPGRSGSLLAVEAEQMMSVKDVQDILAVPLLGVIPDDEQVVVSTNNGEPLILNKELSQAGTAVSNIARRLQGEKVPLMDLSVPKDSFFKKLRQLFQ